MKTHLHAFLAVLRHQKLCQFRVLRFGEALNSITCILEFIYFAMKAYRPVLLSTLLSFSLTPCFAGNSIVAIYTLNKEAFDPLHNPLSTYMCYTSLCVFAEHIEISSLGDTL